jgi:hypothetical protein
MRRLSGRVVVKETNSGIADLVVAAYDANLESAEAVLDAIEFKGRDNFGRRITSVITDGQGAFCISGDDLRFSGNESRPNLLLVVFAPEDVQSAAKPFPLRPDKRILYISSVPRSDAGAEEAFVIRLLQEQLQQFSILQGDSPPKTNAGANLLQNATDQTVALRTGVQEKIGPYLRKPKNPNEWFREKLFNPWRDRALRRIYADTGLRQSLNKKASIVLGNNGKSITIGIKGTENGKDVVIPLNVDHITGHAEAVKKALVSGKASYLVETVAARYLQLLSGRENQAQIERLRDEFREDKPTYLGKEVPLGDVLKNLP